MNTLCTTNRKLEVFLYSLGIKASSSRVLWDGMVEWTYENTEEFSNAFEIYKRTKLLLHQTRQDNH